MCMFVCRKGIMSKIYKLIIEYDDVTEEIEFISEEIYGDDVNEDYLLGPDDIEKDENEEDEPEAVRYIRMHPEYWDPEDIERLKSLGIVGDA